MPLARYTCTGWLVLLFLMSSRASPHSPLARVNPWLSACDLHQSSPPDLQGSCTRMISEFPGPPTSPPPPPGCPPPCSSSSSTRSTSRNSDNTTQCLEYLNESHKTVLCRGDGGGGGGWDGGAWRSLRLTHCCEHSVVDSLNESEWRAGGAECQRAVQALIDVDLLAGRLECEFAEVLTRYDCGQSYSVNFHCSHCQEAYRQWVCASLVPHWLHGRHRVKPCRAVCQRVEQKCPFFLPSDRAPSYPTQYAGEPTFLCLDPNIPETGEQLERSTYSSSCCMSHCGGELCVTPTGCAPSRAGPTSEQCTGGPTPAPSPCSAAAASSPSRAAASSSRHLHHLTLTLAPTLALLPLLTHLLTRRCRKRTKISWK